MTSKKPTLTRAEVRELDRRAIHDFKIPGIVLMENAGRGVVEQLIKLGINKLEIGGPVVVCCGKGNNGGDGLVIARHLDFHSIAVEVLLCCNPSELTGDAAINYNIVANSRIPILICATADLDSADEATSDQPSSEKISSAHTWPQIASEKLQHAAWIIDALLGTGATGESRYPIDRMIELINHAHRPVMAVDLPSGLDCDTGIPARQTVRATHTCTFVAAKPGFENPLAQPFMGIVHIVQIGASRVLVDEMLRPNNLL